MHWFRGIVTLALLQAVVCSWLLAADMKPEDLVAKHLDSIGTTEVRKAAKSRAIQGTARFKILVGGAGELTGNSGIVSEQRKSDLVLKFGNNDYRGEQFVCDGDKFYISATTASHHRSTFGEFVWSQGLMLREGLLGGELSTAWALLNLDQNHPKLSYEGLKKFDGKQVHSLRYRSQKSDDMTIRMYFDPENFHHLATVYSITLSSGLGGSVPSISDQAGLTTSTLNPGGDPTQSSKQREVRYTVEERFSDFKTTDGITLPSHYNIHFTQELQDGRTILYEWDVAADQVSNNVTLDPRNFQIK
jgi:hypothetical protein